MESVGLIGIDRLRLIPKKYWKTHEFCFFLHDCLVQLLVEYEASGAHNVVSDAFREATAAQEQKLRNLDLLEFLKEEGLVDLYHHHIVSHLVVALTADMLHFLFEALTCFEKRKFSVGFSVLRKPLKEHLLYLAWILADEKGFVSRFSENGYQTLKLGAILPEQRVELYERAIEKLPIGDAFDAALIAEVIYSKQHDYGFEPTWQRATHLVTSMGQLLKTERYSLNFIFDDPRENHYYEFLYSKLPYILTFMSQITLEGFNRISELNSLTFSHLLIVVMGCYEALFLKGSKQHVANMIRKDLKKFLKCIHCSAPLKLTKKNAPNLYMSEQLRCTQCGLLSDMPLYWILSFANFKIAGRDSPAKARE